LRHWTWNFPGISYFSDLRQTRCARKIPKPVLETAFIKWWSGWICWLLLQRSWVRIPGKSWSFSVGLALDWQSSLLKNKPCLEWPVCGVEKVIDLLTWLGLNSQIGRLSCHWFIFLLITKENHVLFRFWKIFFCVFLESLNSSVTCKLKWDFFYQAKVWLRSNLWIFLVRKITGFLQGLNPKR
jgi:hypothetical protein